MAISVFHHPAFVGVCAALAGGSLAAAVAVWARTFWSELAAKFLRLPAAGKAAFVAFVAVATAVAQKPGNVATDSTDSHGLGEAVLSTDYTDLHGLGSVVLDRIDKIDRIEETETVSAETSDTLSNPVNPVKDNLRVSATPCEKSVTDDDIARGYRLAEVRTNETVSYELPTNGTVVGTWHLTDAYDAVVRVWLEEGRRKKKKEEVRNFHPCVLFRNNKTPQQPHFFLLPSYFFLPNKLPQQPHFFLLPSSLFLPNKTPQQPHFFLLPSSFFPWAVMSSPPSGRTCGGGRGRS